MGFVESSLTPGEVLVYRAQKHWKLFFLPVFLLFVALVVYSSLSFKVGHFFLVLALLSSIKPFVIYKTSEFAVTNRRVLAKVGFIRRQSLDILLTKVESVSVNQNILGRILDYGTIVVIGSGGTREYFPDIWNPLELHRQIHIQL
jgi:uncharacterized membrane protein YdbT with pleckstrin-like domain